MDSKQYLWTLRTQLTGKMKRDELERVMTYYYEYFKEAGPDGEAGIMEELGTPDELTTQILGQMPPPAAQPTEDANYGYAYDCATPPRRSGMPIGLKIVLGFLIFPVMLALVLSAFILVVSLGGAAIVCVAAGFFSAWAGLTAILQNGATTILFMGGGMMAVGIGLLLMLGTLALGKVSAKGTGCFFRWLFTGRGA